MGAVAITISDTSLCSETACATFNEESREPPVCSVSFSAEQLFLLSENRRRTRVGPFLRDLNVNNRGVADDRLIN